MEVFVDVWEAQVEELGKVLRLITAGGDPSKSKWTAEKHRWCWWKDTFRASSLCDNQIN